MKTFSPRLFHLGVFALLGLLWNHRAQAAGTIYAMTFNSPGDLYTVNPASGATTFVANTGMSQANGIAFDAAGQMYSNSNNGRFYRINHVTGETVATSRAMVVSPLEGDLAYNAAADNFLAADSVHSFLYNINKTTGAGAVVGNFGIGQFKGVGSLKRWKGNLRLPTPLN